MEELRYRYYVTALVTIGITALVGWLLALWSPANSGEVANWVQAVGSIAALLITGGLFLAQREAERKREGDSQLLMSVRSARRAQAICYWAVEAMDRAVESHEAGGAIVGLPFRATRLDHLRAMMERVAETTEDNPTCLIALAVCKKLNEAFNILLGSPQDHPDITLDTLVIIRNDTQTILDNLVVYQQKLERKCRSRRIPLEASDMS